MRTVVATTSIINVGFGVFVTGLFILTDNNPWVVLAIGLGLIVQGGYTLAYMSGRLGAEPWATRGVLAGQTVAMTVGLGAGVIGVIETLTLDTTGHPEYGPMAAAGLITLQAVSALYVYGIRGGITEVDPPAAT